jgi:hypothetical protein
VKSDAWFVTREKAFNVDWHPGPLGHYFVGAALARFFLKSLRVIAYETLHNSTPSNPVATIQDLNHKGINQGSLDSSDGTCGSLRATQCFTGQLPHLKDYGIHKLADCATTWTLSERSVQSHYGDKLATIDRREVIFGNKSTGELLLNLVVNSPDQYAVLCQPPCHFTCKEGTGYISILGANSKHWKRADENSSHGNSSDAVFTVDGKQVQDDELSSLHNKLFADGAGEFCPGCMRTRDLCQPVAKLGLGQHTIGMSVREGVGDKFLELIQVMQVGSSQELGQLVSSGSSKSFGKNPSVSNPSHWLRKELAPG